MNTSIFFAFLVADISALLIPESLTNTFDKTNERSISNSIEKAIEGVSQSIKESGFDPLYIDERRITKTLPVPILFDFEAFVEDVLSTGLSNIVVHKVSFSLITSRLNFDIELPYIVFSVGAASAEATLFGSSLDVKASGKIEVHSIRIIGQVRVSIGVLSGISIRRVKITFILGDIHSDIILVIQGKNHSCKANKFIGSTVPNTIKAFNREINELLEIILMNLITANIP